MAKFEVQIVGTAVTIVVGSAAAAYRWLDEHASYGDSYVIFGWNSEGKRVPVVEGER
jgi:hypothetical protein